MKSTISRAIILSLLPLIGSCDLIGFRTGSSASADNSALIDPPWVTLKEGIVYEFEEGKLEGRGQAFLSGYEFRRQTIERTSGK